MVRKTEKGSVKRVKTASSPKAKSGGAKKSKIKKGKVNIPAYRVVFFCGIVIVVCLVLLLVTTLGEGKTAGISEKSVPQTVQVQPEESVKKSPAESQKEKSSEKSQVQAKTQGQSKDTLSQSQSKKSAAQNQPQKSTAQTQTQSKPANSSAQATNPKSRSEENLAVVNVQTPPVKTENQNPPKAKTYEFNFPKAVNGAELVVVLDDGGQNLNQLKKFLNLPFPVTIAVLPKLPHSAESARLIRQSGNEVILHQPMQAVNQSVNPGPGAIKPDMTPTEISMLVQENIDEIAPIAGMNNHEGSLITADETKIGVVIEIAHQNGMFFLDSRTNKDTKVPAVSKAFGYGWYERNGFFLDNEKTREEFLKELRKNLDIANKSGSVIMIAHIWSADYLPALLNEVYPELSEKGYTFKTVSKSRGMKK